MKSLDLTLYLVADPSCLCGNDLQDAVRQAILGGCTLVQLRDKNASARELYEEGLRVKAVCDAYGVPLIVNDRVDVALALGAAGAHVGQSDLPAVLARRLLGGERILGVSAHNPAEAAMAAQDGADYLGVGAIFPTCSKSDAQRVPLQEIAAIRAVSGLPIAAIGGVNSDTLPLLEGCKLDGVAVISAILSQSDVRAAAARLRREFSAIRDKT